MINIINKMKDKGHDIKIDIEEDKKNKKVYFIINVDNEPIIKIEELKSDKK